MLEHGGRLKSASKMFDIPEADWLDLSTGINPNGWSVPEVPPSIWQRLPEMGDGLEEAAGKYFKCNRVLPMSGSQAAIQLLPKLRAKSRVAVFSPAYAEHGYHWDMNGHEVIKVSAEDDVDMLLDELDVVVVVNPNNPSARLLSVEKLSYWHKALAEKGGMLVVDEAFMDATPRYSMVPLTSQPGLVVLRSLGKFFGLAGARLGFVMAEESLLDALAEAQGPWPVAGPSRWVATQALLDREWQLQTRKELHKASLRLANLLSDSGFKAVVGTALFQWFKTANAAEIYRCLAQEGILVRLFDEPASLRFGLPKQEPDWQRLENTLKRIKDNL